MSMNPRLKHELPGPPDEKDAPPETGLPGDPDVIWDDGEADEKMSLPGDPDLDS